MPPLLLQEAAPPTPPQPLHNLPLLRPTLGKLNSLLLLLLLRLLPLQPLPPTTTMASPAPFPTLAATLPKWLLHPTKTTRKPAQQLQPRPLPLWTPPLKKPLLLRPPLKLLWLPLLPMLLLRPLKPHRAMPPPEATAVKAVLCKRCLRIEHFESGKLDDLTSPPPPITVHSQCGSDGKSFSMCSNGSWIDMGAVADDTLCSNGKVGWDPSAPGAGTSQSAAAAARMVRRTVKHRRAAH